MSSPSKLFRRRGADSLPLTSSGSNGNFPASSPSAATHTDPLAGGGAASEASSSASLFSLFRRSSASHLPDGSARSIRLQKSLGQVWRETSLATRLSYILSLTFIFMIWWGVRWIRFNSAHIHLQCRMSDCTLILNPRGWSKKVTLNFPRRQLLQTMAIKAKPEGVFVSAHPNLYETAGQQPQTGPGKSNPHYSNYKGPDADGLYTSYALIFDNNDVVALPDAAVKTPPESETAAKAIDFSQHAVTQYLDSIGNGQFRLVMRLFQIPQSKRRVSTMIHRIESYIKKRRQSLVVKENAVPSWQGIVMLVVGIVGLLLTFLLGQFWDDREHGNRKRRQQLHEKHRFANKQQDSYKQAIPPQFEVRTAPLRSSYSNQTSAGTTRRAGTVAKTLNRAASAGTFTKR